MSDERRAFAYDAANRLTRVYIERLGDWLNLAPPEANMDTENIANRPFIKGLMLGELFYEEAVKPILAKHFAATAG